MRGEAAVQYNVSRDETEARNEAFETGDDSARNVFEVALAVHVVVEVDVVAGRSREGLSRTDCECEELIEARHIFDGVLLLFGTQGLRISAAVSVVPGEGGKIDAVEHDACCYAKVPSAVVINHAFDMDRNQEGQSIYRNDPARKSSRHCSHEDIRDQKFGPGDENV